MDIFTSRLASVKTDDAESPPKVRRGRRPDPFRKYLDLLESTSTARRALTAARSAPDGKRRRLERALAKRESALNAVRGDLAGELGAAIQAAVQHRDPLLGALVFRFAPHLLRLM